MLNLPNYAASFSVAIDQGPRRMPTLAAIAQYWETQQERFPENQCHVIGLGEPYCFACGQLAPVEDGPTVAAAWRRASGWLERAHLADRSYGGSDQVDNVVALCVRCHGEMPSFFDTDMALLWVRAHELAHQRSARELAAFVAIIAKDPHHVPPVAAAWLAELAELLHLTIDEVVSFAADLPTAHGTGPTPEGRT